MLYKHCQIIGMLEYWNIAFKWKKKRTWLFEKLLYLSFPRRRESRNISQGTGFLLSQE
jgi:hypothetical protein